MLSFVMFNSVSVFTDGLLYCVWYSLVAHVKNVLETAGKKDSVDVFVCFLENLHQIVHSDTLAADRVLVYILHYIFDQFYS